MDDFQLKCHMISLVKALKRPEVGKQITNPIVCVSMDGKIQFCNPAFEQMVEKEMTDLVGTQIFNNAKEEKARIKESLDTAYETGVSLDTGMFGGKKVKWKCELVTPGDAYFLFSGEILGQSERVIGFPKKQASV